MVVASQSRDQIGEAVLGLAINDKLRLVLQRGLGRAAILYCLGREIAQFARDLGGYDFYHCVGGKLGLPHNANLCYA